MLALGSFVVLGLPDGMLGPAWPAMRQTFGAPIADLGLILLVSTAGSVAVTAFVGWLIRRIGVPALLSAAGVCAALGGAGFALAPGLWLVLAVGVLVGVAAGMMDGGLNTAIGLAGRPRLLNLLHAAYGVGTTIGRPGRPHPHPPPPRPPPAPPPRRPPHHRPTHARYRGPP